MLTDLLNVAPGSISDVPADDLGSLWTVFTKVKANIKDGRRLENLSWRLWYQEVLAPRKHLIPTTASSPFLASPPTHQPTLIHDDSDASPSEDSSDDLATDVEPLELSPPPPVASSSHAQSSSSPPTTAAKPVARPSLLRKSSSKRRTARIQIPSSHPDSTVVQRPAQDRANSTLTRTTQARSRRPPSFNLGNLLAAPVPELRAMQLQSFSSDALSSPECEAAVVTVDTPSTPPPHEHPLLSTTPALVVLQPTPRPTPPDSPRVPTYRHNDEEIHRADTLLPVPHLGSPSPTISVPHEIPPETTTAGPGPPSSTTTTMLPVPVDDPRCNKRRTFFFKESPSAGEDAGASSGSASSAAKTPVVPTAIPTSTSPDAATSIGSIDDNDGEAGLDLHGQATGATVAPVSNARVPVMTAVRKGKEPARQLTRPTNRQVAAVGHRAAASKLGAHQRHHSTIFGQVARGAPTRSKSSAAITTVPVFTALAANVAGPSQHPAAPAPRRSTSSSRPPPPASNVSSTKTIVAPTSPPSRIPEPAPAPAPPASSPAIAQRPAASKPQSPPMAPPKTAKSTRVEAATAVATSSDFETTDTEGDDSSWASDYSDEEDEPETGNIAKEAAAEAARQRDMFAKVPTRSYTDLARNNTNRGGLTSLFHPDPALLPMIQGHHPFRAHNSAMNLGSRPAPPPSNVQGLQTSKSSAAMPLAAQVTVTQTQVGVNPSGRPGYRLKGRPEGQEFDESSDEDGEDDAVPLSKSVAQRRLEVLAGMRSKKLAGPAAAAPPAQAQRRLPSQLRMTATPEEDEGVLPQHETSGEYGNALMRNASAPIVLPHPYNLPAPAPPATPRTTRREMLATEMSESLRRQILWERQTNQRIWRRSSNGTGSSTAERKKPVGVYGEDGFHASGW